MLLSNAGNSCSKCNWVLVKTDKNNWRNIIHKFESPSIEIQIFYLNNKMEVLVDDDEPGYHKKSIKVNKQF